MEFAPSLFSTRVPAGKRTYFVDVKSAKNNKPFLKITQSELNGEERKKNYLNVFESEIAGTLHPDPAADLGDHPSKSSARSNRRH